MPACLLRPLRPASFLVGCGLLAYVGCSSSGTTAVAVTHPTMIQVAPEDFLGSVPCSEGPGLKRYVATLIDTDYQPQGGASGVDPTGDTAAGGAPVEFQLPSSLPTPCLAAVGFGLVVAGRHYDVKIDGYDTDDLAPRASGSRQMVSPATPADAASALLTPRWTAECKDAVAIGSTIVRADHCTTFTPLDVQAPGSLRIQLSALLDGLSCGDQPGQVDHFEVSLDAGEAQPRQQSVACEAGAEAVFADLGPRQRVSAYVTAFSADSTDAFAGANCDAFTSPEASVAAECAPLSQVGTVRLDLRDALGKLGLTCDAASISSVTVQSPGDELGKRIQPPDCLQPFEQGFAAGPVVLRLAVQPLGATEPTAFVTYTAEVAPGQLVLATRQEN